MLPSNRTREASNMFKDLQRCSDIAFLMGPMRFLIARMMALNLGKDGELQGFATEKKWVSENCGGFIGLAYYERGERVSGINSHTPFPCGQHRLPSVLLYDEEDAAQPIKPRKSVLLLVQ